MNFVHIFLAYRVAWYNQITVIISYMILIMPYFERWVLSVGALINSVTPTQQLIGSLLGCHGNQRCTCATLSMFTSFGEWCHRINISVYQISGYTNDFSTCITSIVASCETGQLWNRNVTLVDEQLAILYIFMKPHIVTMIDIKKKT